MTTIARYLPVGRPTLYRALELEAVASHQDSTGDSTGRAPAADLLAEP